MKSQTRWIRVLRANKIVLQFKPNKSNEQTVPSCRAPGHTNPTGTKKTKQVDWRSRRWSRDTTWQRHVVSHVTLARLSLVDLLTASSYLTHNLVKTHVLHYTQTPKSNAKILNTATLKESSRNLRLAVATPYLHYTNMRAHVHTHTHDIKLVYTFSNHPLDR